MTKRPITITEDTGIDKALELMHSEKVRRLPVLNKQGQLVGIVSELDLLKASPSPATSLSIYELPYLLSRIKMRDIMTKDVVTVTEDTPLEPTKTVSLLGGELSMHVFAGLESGKITINSEERVRK